MPEPPPARVRDRRVPGHRAGGDCGRPDQKLLVVTGSPIGFEMAPLWSAEARPEPVGPQMREWLKLAFPIRCVLRRSRRRRPVQHRNRPVAKGVGPACPTPLRASFCDAASGRASIYACKAFNTEARAGSNVVVWVVVRHQEAQKTGVCAQLLQQWWTRNQSPLWLAQGRLSHRSG